MCLMLKEKITGFFIVAVNLEADSYMSVNNGCRLTYTFNNSRVIGYINTVKLNNRVYKYYH